MLNVSIKVIIMLPEIGDVLSDIADLVTILSFWYGLYIQNHDK